MMFLIWKKTEVNPNPFLTKKTLLLYFNPSPAERETKLPKIMPSNINNIKKA